MESFNKYGNGISIIIRYKRKVSKFLGEWVLKTSSILGPKYYVGVALPVTLTRRYLCVRLNVKETESIQSPFSAHLNLM